MCYKVLKDYIVHTATKTKNGNTHERDPNHRQCNLFEVEAINQRGGYYQNVQVINEFISSN